MCASYAKPTDYPKFDIDMTVDEFKEWEHDKEHPSSVIATRRSNRLAREPWRRLITPPGSKSMDDSMKAFLAVKGKAAAE